MGYTQQPVPVQVQVSNPNTSNQDSTIGNLLGGRSLEALIAELHGKYYQQTYRGNMFSAATAAAGVLIPVESTTAPTFGIWNPAGSGYNAVMVAATYGFISTTAAPGNIGLTVKKGAGSAIATAAPISTFNAAAAGVVQNMLLGGGNASRMNVTIAGTNALTSAGMLTVYDIRWVWYEFPA